MLPFDGGVDISVSLSSEIYGSAPNEPGEISFLLFVERRIFRWLEWIYSTYMLLIVFFVGDVYLEKILQLCTT